MEAAELNATTMSNLAMALETAQGLKAEVNVLTRRLANCDAKLVEASRLNADAVAQADVLRNQNGQYRDMLSEVKFAIDGFAQEDDE